MTEQNFIRRTAVELKLKKNIEWNRAHKELFEIDKIEVWGRNKIAAAKRMALRGEIEIIEATLIGGKVFYLTVKI